MGVGSVGYRERCPRTLNRNCFQGTQNESSLSCISLIRIGQEVVLREDSLWWTMDTSKPHYTVSPHYS